MYLSFNHNLEVMKNTTYIEKCLEFDAVTYILTFMKKGYCSLYCEKIAFCLKRGVILGASKSAISVEKRVFFRPKSAKRRCFSTKSWGVREFGGGGGGGGIFVIGSWHFDNFRYRQYVISTKLRLSRFLDSHVWMSPINTIGTSTSINVCSKFQLLSFSSHPMST